MPKKIISNFKDIPINKDIPDFFKTDQEYEAVVKMIDDANGNKFLSIKDLAEKTSGNKTVYAENNLRAYLDGLTRLILEQIVPTYAEVVDPFEKFNRPKLIVGNGYQELGYDLQRMNPLDNSILIPDVPSSTQTNQVYNHAINYEGERSIVFQFADLQLVVTAIARVNEIINRYIQYLYLSKDYDAFTLAVKIIQKRIKNTQTIYASTPQDILIQMQVLARKFAFPTKNYNSGFPRTGTLTPVISTNRNSREVMPVFSPEIEAIFNKTYATFYNQMFINTEKTFATPLILPINEDQEVIPAVTDPELHDATTGLPNSIALIGENAVLKATQFEYTAPMTWKNGQMTYTYTVRTLTDLFLWKNAVLLNIVMALQSVITNPNYGNGWWASTTPTSDEIETHTQMLYPSYIKGHVTITSITADGATMTGDGIVYSGSVNLNFTTTTPPDPSGDTIDFIDGLGTTPVVS